MKSSFFTIMFLVVMSCTVLAGGKAQAGNVYVGVHGGKILLKERAKNELNEDHYSGGLVVGMDTLDFKQTIFAIEADFSFPLAEGTSTYYGQWGLTTAGLFGCLRVGKSGAFLKVKLGMIYENIEVDGYEAEGADDLGLSMGLGGGARLGKGFFLELEASIIDEDMGYLRGMVGYHF